MRRSVENFFSLKVFPSKDKLLNQPKFEICIKYSIAKEFLFFSLKFTYFYEWIKQIAFI